MISYKIVRKNIIEYIKENDLKTNDKLPSEAELSNLFRVSRVIIREALNGLREEGFIYTKQGKGTFISFSPINISDTLNNNLGITEMMESQNLKPGFSYFNRQLTKIKKEISELLNINSNSNILTLERVRTANDLPVVYTIDYFAPHLASEFLKIDDENISIYNFLEKKAKITIGYNIAEIMPIKCNSLIAKKLNYNKNGPLMLLKQLITDVKGEPQVYVIEYFRPDVFKFAIIRKREN